MNFKNLNIKTIASYIPSILLAFVYVAHGIQALMLSEEFIQTTMIAGFSETVATVLVFLVGILDIAVVGLVLFYPNVWVLLWAGFWPIVPNVLNFIGRKGGEPPEIIIIIVLASLVYYLKVHRVSK